MFRPAHNNTLTGSGIGLLPARPAGASPARESVRGRGRARAGAGQRSVPGRACPDSRGRRRCPAERGQQVPGRHGGERCEGHAPFHPNCGTGGRSAVGLLIRGVQTGYAERARSAPERGRHSFHSEAVTGKAKGSGRLLGYGQGLDEPVEPVATRAPDLGLSSGPSVDLMAYRASTSTGSPHRTAPSSPR